MARRVLALCLVIGLAVPQPTGAQTGPDADLAIGIRHVREGDFDAALITLDGVVRRLSTQKGQASELARAYTYLAIAYVGLAQQETAKAKFLEAWKTDKSLTLSPKEFPPNIIEFFEQARKEGEEKDRAQAATAGAPKPAPRPPASAEAAKKGGGHKGLILLGVGGAVAAGIGIAAKGGSRPDAPDFNKFYGTYSNVIFNTQVSGCAGFSAILMLSGNSDGSNFRLFKSYGEVTFTGTIQSSGDFTGDSASYSIRGQTIGNHISGTESQKSGSPVCTWTFDGSR